MTEESQLKSEPQETATSTDTEQIKTKIIEVLHTCYDPEIPVDIYELGLIYDIKVSHEGFVNITMTLTAPNCPEAESIPIEVETKAKSVQDVKEVKVNLTFDPPWNQSLMSEAAKLQLGMG